MDNQAQPNPNVVESPFDTSGGFVGEPQGSPFDTPGITEAGAQYFLKITSLPEQTDKDTRERKSKKVRSEILELNSVLYLHATLANLTIQEVKILQLAYDKKAMMVLMFLDRNTITPEEYDYVESLKTQYYLMLTRAIGGQRERITQTQQVTTRLIGEAQNGAFREKPQSIWDWFKR